MSESPPVVGVVLPVFNVEPWLDAMLASLRAQTYANWSAIIVDDGSTDGGVEIAERHAGLDPRIRVASNPHHGPGARLARIHGRSLLSNDVDYVYFPDADDVLEPLLIERLVERLEARPGAVAAFCDFTTIDEDGEALTTAVTQRLALSRRWVRCIADADEDTPFETLYSGAAAWEGLTMFRRTAYDQAGGYERSPAWESHTVLDLLLRLSALGRVVFVAERLYRRRRRPGQASDNRRMLVLNDKALKRLWAERATSDPDLRQSLAHAEFLLLHRAAPRRRLVRAVAFARRGNLLATAPRVVLALLYYRWRIPPSVRSSVRDFDH